jgi:hypothetical protein
VRLSPAFRALSVWLLVAAALGAALLLAGRVRSPLDDADQARQRPDFLDSVGPRTAAPQVTALLPTPGRIMVVFFVRGAQQHPLRMALEHRGALPPHVDTAILGGPVSMGDQPIPLISDSDGSLARRFLMPVPRDGGYPVGYAICGPDGTVRYRTLDPGVASRLRDVRAMVGAI